MSLDVRQVAFLLKDRGPGAAEPNWLAQFGLDAKQVRFLPIGGWALAATPAARQSGEGVMQLVSELAADSRMEFVSPVLIGDSRGPVIITPHILARFGPDVPADQAEGIIAQLAPVEIVESNWAGTKGAYRLRSGARTGTKVLAAANALAEQTEVQFAEPDVICTVRHLLIPNDPGFPNCWGLHNTGQSGGIRDVDVDAPEAWDVTTGLASVIVVVMDDGVQQDHPDINQIAGADFTGSTGSGGPVKPCDNHGTAVAGCVSARINNHLGTVGVAPGCKVASARVIVSWDYDPCVGDGWGQPSYVVNALGWAQSIGARVTNASWTFDTQTSALDQAYADTRAAGIVHFAGSGNSGTSGLGYPASLPSVNAVGAVDPFGNLAAYSTYGPGLAFCAPGDGYTTDRTGAAGYGPGDYTLESGTSFASPYAAGIAALVLSVDPSLSAAEVEEVLRGSCMDLGPPGYDTTYGWGLLNARAAVCAVLARLGKLDQDQDGLVDTCDNCPATTNPDQQDQDDNGIGDVCEVPSFEIVAAQMVSPTELGIGIDVTYPASSDPKTPRKVTFRATINGRAVESTIDVTSFTQPGQAWGPKSGQNEMFDVNGKLRPDTPLRINLEDHQVERFDENQEFTLAGEAFCEGGPKSDPSEIEVKILLPVVVLHGYVHPWGYPLFAHVPVLNFFGGFLSDEAAYKSLRQFLQDNGYSGEDQWDGTGRPAYRTLWDPSDFRYTDPNRATPAVIQDELDGLLDGKVFKQSYARKVSFVGHSFGGLVARYYACVRPKRVRKVITVGTPHTGATLFYKVAFSFDRPEDFIQRLKVPQGLPHAGEESIILWTVPRYKCLENGPDPSPFRNTLDAGPAPGVDYYSLVCAAYDSPASLILEKTDTWYRVADVTKEAGDGYILSTSAGAFVNRVSVCGSQGSETHGFLLNLPRTQSTILAILADEFTGGRPVAGGGYGPGCASECLSGLVLPATSPGTNGAEGAGLGGEQGSSSGEAPSQVPTEPEGMGALVTPGCGACGSGAPAALLACSGVLGFMRLRRRAGTGGRRHRLY